MIRSSCRITYKWFINIINSCVTTNLGVINTIVATSSGWWLSHTIYNIPSLLYRRFMSPYNIINGMIIMVVPPYSTYASNMNNILLPAPIGIMATMGLSPPIIALMASFYTL
ncbi:hypothetical protein PSPO01_15543 [Paraphaeosphaeria sporulosa]